MKKMLKSLKMNPKVCERINQIQNMINANLPVGEKEYTFSDTVNMMLEINEYEMGNDTILYYITNGVYERTDFRRK